MERVIIINNNNEYDIINENNYKHFTIKTEYNFNNK